MGLIAIEDRLYTVLHGNAALEALVSTRIYPCVALQGATCPFVVYTRIGGAPASSLDGNEHLDIGTYQIDTYALTESSARAVALAVDEAMDQATTFKALITARRADYASDVRLYRRIHEYSVMSDEEEQS